MMLYVAWQLGVKLGVEFYDLQSLEHTQSILWTLDNWPICIVRQSKVAN